MRSYLLAVVALVLAPVNLDLPPEGAIVAPAVAEAPAVRLDQPVTLTGCAEFHALRVAAGLPDRFDRLAWRESNCRNDVRTYCCYGYLQLYVSLHLRDHRLGDRYREECGVHGVSDIYGTALEQKVRQVCAAAVLYDVEGWSPWAQ